jgi:chromosome segregation ATPase
MLFENSLITTGRLFPLFFLTLDRSALDVIEDHCPHAMPSEILSSESILFQTDGSSDRNENLVLTDVSGNQKIRSLAAKLQKTHATLFSEQERTASVITKYRYFPMSRQNFNLVRKSLQRAENELEKKNSEVMLLTQRLEMLTSYVKEKQSGTDEANDKIESVSKRLEAQMQELKKKDGPNAETRKQITGYCPFFLFIILE